MTPPKARPKKRKDGEAKRRKVSLACVYCRRSHMTCDSERPCQRCVRRGIGHLCHDRPMNQGPASESPAPTSAPGADQPSPTSAAASAPPPPSAPPPVPAWGVLNPAMGFPPAPQWPPAPPGASPAQPSAARNWPYPPTGLAQPPAPPRNPSWFGLPPGQQPWDPALPESGTNTNTNTNTNEYQMLSDFLESLNSAMGYPQGYSQPPSQSPGQSPHEPRGMSLGAGSALDNPAPDQARTFPLQRAASSSALSRPVGERNGLRASAPAVEKADGPPNLPWTSKAEQFIMTAADQHDGSRESRLGRVIRAKHDAGLLKPYNHIKGYARLLKWMDCNVSADSRRRILQPLSVFRPAFRAVAQQLTDIDLIYIEEAFERLLLDYDRVFASQGIPACLWRRTGEIYKANKEFAELIGVSIDALREGRLCIYELMAEESAVNYWERYGAVSFDPGQKAVLTTCVLKVRKPPRQRSSVPVARQIAAQLPISSQVQTTASAPPAASTSKPSSPKEEPEGLTRRRSSVYSASAGLAPWKMTPKDTQQEEEKTVSPTSAAPPTGQTSGNSSAPSGSAAAPVAAPVAGPSAPPPRRTAEGLYELKCCFSFTIRRDQWNIPTMVVGNFLPFDPA